MFSSLRNFFGQRYSSMLRYPLSTIISISISVLGVIYNHEYSYDISHVGSATVLIRIIFALIFTLPLSLIPGLIKQMGYRYSGIGEYIGQIIVLFVGLLFYYSLPYDVNAMYNAEGTRVIISFVMAWTLPFVGIVFASKMSDESIWGWSQQGIIKFIVAGVASAIVGGGIAACLSSIEYLFGVSIHSKIYMDVRVVVRSLIGINIWLIGLVDDPEERLYSKLFRFFGLYIFLPLASVYALILLFYGLQILFTGDRPHGKVTWMIIGYTVFGLFGYVLTYPLRGTHSYVRSVHKAYFISLLLFVLLLIAAISIRISDYGLTTERYIICIIGLWIIIISIVSLYKIGWSLAVILTSFVGLTLLMNIGPWSVHTLPTTLQFNTLTSLLHDSGFLDENAHIKTRKIYSITGDVGSGTMKRIYDSASYVASEEGIGIFKPLYGSTGFDQLSGSDRWNSADKFMISLLGVDAPTLYNVNTTMDTPYLNFYSHDPSHNLKLTSISDYRYMLYLSVTPDQQDLIQTGLQVHFQGTHRSRITIQITGKTYTVDLQDHMAEIVQSAKRSQMGENLASLMLTGSDYLFVLDTISLETVDKETYSSMDYKGILFLK